ncbi:MAG: hypothetical protein H6618_02730 [Deltaproteobacteria bacterium]|nr:hypothetical protein [Deltaproteobacteria bacterium]
MGAYRRPFPMNLPSFIALICLLLTFSCQTGVDAPAIGNHISAPVSIASSSDEMTFYALSGDFNQNYPTGSISMIRSQDGTVLRSLETQHYGRVLRIAGDSMLVGYDDPPGKEQHSQIELYKLGSGPDPALPERQKSWSFPGCRVADIALKKAPTAEAVHSTFAVACEDGTILLGTLNHDDMTQTKLHKARDRAGSTPLTTLHLIPQLDLLFIFAKKLDDPTIWRDRIMKTSSDGDIPDEIATNKNRRQKVERDGSEYQFRIIDLANPDNKNAEGDFTERPHNEVRDQEFRWLYWTATQEADEHEFKAFEESVKNAESKSEAKDEELAELKKKYHYYRSNISAVVDAPEDLTGRSFYLVHRGDQSDLASPHANGVIRMSLVDQIQVSDLFDKGKSTQQLLHFEKVYGQRSHRILTDPTKSGEDKTHPDNLRKSYHSSMAFVSLGDQDKSVMVVCHHRGAELFTDPLYALTAVKTTSTESPRLWESANMAEKEGGAYYSQIAVSNLEKQAVIAALSFFDDSVRLLRLTEEGQFEELRQIR